MRGMGPSDSPGRGASADRDTAIAQIRLERALGNVRPLRNLLNAELLLAVQGLGGICCHAAARALWNAITSHRQQLLFANVWCTRCRDVTTIVDFSGRTERGDFVLQGRCKICGGEVARSCNCPFHSVT